VKKHKEPKRIKIENIPDDPNWKLRHDMMCGEVKRLEARVHFLEHANDALVREKTELIKQRIERETITQKSLAEANAKNNANLETIGHLEERLKEALQEV
jgi:hypothetical protein